MRRWDFTQAAYWDPEAKELPGYNQHSPGSLRALIDKETEQFNTLLDDGWEPIHAQRNPYESIHRSLVWLRKPL